MKSFSTILAAAALVAGVAAHGRFESPFPRMANDETERVCGKNIRKADNNGPIQFYQFFGNLDHFNPAECDLWLCKGFQFKDNLDHVNEYHTGQVIPIVYSIGATHVGTANISIVETATNKMIGPIIRSWTDFASTAHAVPIDQTHYDITMPNLGGKCSKPGDCVIQHWWNSDEARQTYMSCIDFFIKDGKKSRRDMLSGPVAK